MPAIFVLSCDSRAVIHRVRFVVKRLSRLLGSLVLDFLSVSIWRDVIFGSA